MRCIVLHMKYIYFGQKADPLKSTVCFQNEKHDQTLYPIFYVLQSKYFVKEAFV